MVKKVFYPEMLTSSLLSSINALTTNNSTTLVSENKHRIG
jgi:hypothetical protein